MLRKQLTAAKKRQNHRRPINGTARQLLDGEVIYENEFVTLPKMKRGKRKVSS